eukprot:jgi/Chlat1/3926/Chrsp26S04028
MRIMIKGGVWKNTEDEILKAAVMKYGKNQWSRISSLLVRKSAKQCKARWYEWLDPSIKKTEWTREEDEKLLHLAKLMPTQWRTIAPIVGRTPAQCLERYEKLLDAAVARDENYDAADDPRRLRPGEIDPNPESKPARPDPVDMDEDEKEMLSEARARLANTKGKKAKRKAREKQLEEARRLASLQKRRELKASGLDHGRRRRKPKGVDYLAEIPFEKKPPPGFYDTTKEEKDKPSDSQFIGVTLEQMEGKRRVDVEAQLRKIDAAKNKILERHDAPSAVQQVNKLNDPGQVRKRSKLNLPAPQISDRELEEIARMGGGAMPIDEDGEGSGATRMLVANYQQTPQLAANRTPARTPAGAGQSIMMEAENLARLTQAQTPLMGGENPLLHPSDFSGVTPKRADVQTPNPLATPLRTPGGNVAATPGRFGATPGRGAIMTAAGYPGATPTPVRDELRINDAEALTGENARAEKQRLAAIRNELRSGLGSLPVPKNEYQIVVPDLVDEEQQEEAMEEDMADVNARAAAVQAAREAAELKKRTLVIQRGMPRPASLVLMTVKPAEALRNLTALEKADELLKAEMMRLLEEDAAQFPMEGKKRKQNLRQTPSREKFELAELEYAARLVEEEVQFLRGALGQEDVTVEQFIEAWRGCAEEVMFLPSLQRYGRAATASMADKVASLALDHDNARKNIEAEVKKAAKIENKLNILTTGYQTRAEALWKETQTLYQQVDTTLMELECFRALRSQEVKAAQRRLSTWKELAAVQQERERTLQTHYAQLQTEVEDARARRQDANASDLRADIPSVEGDAAKATTPTEGPAPAQIGTSEQSNGNASSVMTDAEFLGRPDADGDAGAVSGGQTKSTKSGSEECVTVTNSTADGPVPVVEV